MADLSYHHGVKLTESGESPALVRWNRFGVVGVIGTAPDADATAFPLNKPVLAIGSRVTATSIGATGTLPHAIETLRREGCSHMIVVRVEQAEDGGSEDVAGTRANIIGSLNAKTGAYAFLDSHSLLDIRPRVLIAPGYTSHFTDGGVAAISVSEGGTGYSSSPTVTITGDGTGATAEAVVVGGVITAINVLTAGSGYTTATVSITDDTGSDAAATTTIGDVANPVVTALQSVAHFKQVRARAYVGGPATTDTAAVQYRNTINNGRVMVIDPNVLQYDADSDTYPQRPPETVFAGVRSRVVRDYGVSESVSNKPINSIEGVSRIVSYGDEANYLNERQISTIIKYRGGFRTWGSRLAYDDALWQFDSVRATADMINEAIEDVQFSFTDRKFSKANLKFLVESTNAVLRLAKANGDILGGRTWIDDERSTPEEMANGRVWLGVEFEPPAIMEQIRTTTYRNIAYYSVLLDEVSGLIDEGPLSVAA